MKLPEKTEIVRKFALKNQFFVCEIAWKNRNFSEIFQENRNFLTQVHDHPRFQNRLTPLTRAIGSPAYRPSSSWETKVILVQGRLWKSLSNTTNDKLPVLNPFKTLPSVAINSSSTFYLQIILSWSPLLPCRVDVNDRLRPEDVADKREIKLSSLKNFKTLPPPAIYWAHALYR